MAHALLTFLGAFALFMFEPYLGKCLTPRFGGGAQVWVVCLLFFQVVLLAGYAYAHLLARKVSLKRQARLHGILLLGTLFLALFQSARVGHPWALMRPGLAPDPVSELLLTLIKGSALPMGLLAATSPLFHHWYAKQEGGASPFHLYAWSNAGSIGGLLAYPFLVEPLLTARAQGFLLMALLGIFGLGVLWISRRLEGEESVESGPEEPTAAKTQLFWVLAATLGSAAFMAASAFATLEVVSVPLLWILPLLAYLASFIFVFDARWAWAGPTWRPVWGVFLLLGFFLCAYSGEHAQHSTLHLIGGTILFTFAGGMLCHGLLYDRRPGSSGATRFLLLTALGGALGGVALALLVPMVFDRLYDMGLVAVALAVLLALQIEGQRRPIQVFQGLAALALALLASWNLQKTAREPGLFTRNFYGIIHVVRKEPVMLMDNLKTIHGFVDMRIPRTPLTYFTYSSGIGRALRAEMGRKPSLKVGVIGLGVGSVACYDRATDHYTFYEINPAVNEMAGPLSDVFTLLRDAPSPVELVEGDGRLQLEEELKTRGPRGFDVFLVDAFSGDTVPWHLLTPEAFRLYFTHLAPDGLLVIHATNPLPVDRIALLSAREAGLYGVYIVDVPPPTGLTYHWHAKSRYLVMARDPRRLEDPLLLESAVVGFGPKIFSGESRDSWKLAFLKGDRAWTDERSSSSDLLLKRSALDAMEKVGVVPEKPRR